MQEPLSKRTDDELMQAFCAGNKEAFEEIVLRYKNVLYQYLITLVKEEGTAGDLFQEVFLALFKQTGKFQTQGKLKAWLFLTARNKALNYFRDSKRLVSLDETDEDGNAFWHETLEDNELPPLEQLTQAENLQRVRQAVEALPSAQREVVYLRQTLAFKEIAHVLGKPLGTVLADYHRACGKIKKVLLKEVEDL